MERSFCHSERPPLTEKHWGGKKPSTECQPLVYCTPPRPQSSCSPSTHLWSSTHSRRNFGMLCAWQSSLPCLLSHSLRSTLPTTGKQPLPGRKRLPKGGGGGSLFLRGLTWCALTGLFCPTTQEQPVLTSQLCITKHSKHVKCMNKTISKFLFLNLLPKSLCVSLCLWLFPELASPLLILP